jgi:hypothetical protein
MRHERRARLAHIAAQSDNVANPASQ